MTEKSKVAILAVGVTAIHLLILTLIFTSGPPDQRRALVRDQMPMVDWLDLPVSPAIPRARAVPPTKAIPTVPRAPSPPPALPPPTPGPTAPISSPVTEAPPEPTGDAPGAGETLGSTDEAATGPRLPTNLVLARLRYPAQALQRRLEATVVLDLLIDESGTVSQVKVAQDPGHGFAQAAVEALTGLTGAPARTGGQPVAAWLRYPVRFVLP